MVENVAVVVVVLLYAVDTVIYYSPTSPLPICRQ